MTKHTDTLQMIEIDKLIPYANNARTHSDDQIKKIQSSLREFGFVNPVLIDKEYGIIAGHGRVEAAKRENIKEVPCVMVEYLTPAQKKAYILADNRLAEDAEWNMDLVKLELQELQDLDFDLDLTGFDMDEIDLNDDSGEAQDDEYDIELPDEPKSQLGDIYQLGRHRLMCGDSTNKETVEKLMGDQRVDLFITDPPYNVDYEGATKEKLKIKNDSMADDVFRKFLVDAFAAADNVMKSGAAFYIWHADSEGYNFRGACFDTDWKVRQCLIWNKSCLVMGRQDYHWKH